MEIVGPKSVCFLNVNSDRRLKNPLYSIWLEKYQVSTRVKYLSEYCCKKLAEKTVIFLVEVDTEMLDRLTHLLNEKAGDDTFTLFHVPYNQNQASFKFVVLIPKEFEIQEIYHIPYTKSGLFIHEDARPRNDVEKRQNTTYMEETMGELFEKSFLHIVVGNVNVIGTHMGMGCASRILQTIKLVEYIHQHICDTQTVIVGGDFNAFGFDGKVFQEQMDLFTQIKLSNSFSFDTDTFTPYEYDIRFLCQEEDVITYDTFTKSGIVNQKICQDFFDFCKSVKLKEKAQTALDNIFTRNCQILSTQVSPQCCQSDHACLTITIK